MEDKVDNNPIIIWKEEFSTLQFIGSCMGHGFGGGQVVTSFKCFIFP